MLYLEDERRGRFAARTGGGGDAAIIRILFQFFEQRFVFGQVRDGLCVVLEVADETVREVLPTLETTP